MKTWPVILIRPRPSALLCISVLVILIMLPPDRCFVSGGKGGGKKHIAPIKHLFGVGIGYERVVHYKPVLFISKQKRNKKRRRRPGWGWPGPGHHGRGRKGWSHPVVVQHHIYSDTHHHHHHKPPPHSPGHPQQYHHPNPKRRTKSRHQNRYGGSESYRGWGWKPARKDRRNYYHYQDHPQFNPPPQHGGNNNEYDSSNPTRETISHPPPTTDFDYHNNNHNNEPRVEWNGGGRPSYTTYGGGPPVDYADDHNGYESETKEYWNNHNRPLTPLVFPGSTVNNSSPYPGGPPPLDSPPVSPFTDDRGPSDTSVTNIRRDFLKNHLNNFREFQGYQQAHNEPRDNNNNMVGNQFEQSIMNPPGPHYSTTELQSHGSPGPPAQDIQYYDDYYTPPSENNNNRNGIIPQHNNPNPEQGNNPPNYNYNYDHDDVDDDGFNWSELKRKMAPVSSTAAPPPPFPLPTDIVYGTQSSLASDQNNVVVNAHVQTNMQVNSNSNQGMTQDHPNNHPSNPTRFKPSRRIDELGSGNEFTDPGFFPTFDQFRNIGME